MRTWSSSKSFSQGFWPCHSTDRASGTSSAITAKSNAKLGIPRGLGKLFSRIVKRTTETAAQRARNGMA
jgi:hypothetical protein